MCTFIAGGCFKMVQICPNKILCVAFSFRSERVRSDFAMRLGLLIRDVPRNIGAKQISLRIPISCSSTKTFMGI